MLVTTLVLVTLDRVNASRIKRHAAALAALNLPETSRGVALQRRIVRLPRCLPVYGSSELSKFQPTRADLFFPRSSGGGVSRRAHRSTRRPLPVADRRTRRARVPTPRPEDRHLPVADLVYRPRGAARPGTSAASVRPGFLARANRGVARHAHGPGAQGRHRPPPGAARGRHRQNLPAAGRRARRPARRVYSARGLRRVVNAAPGPANGLVPLAGSLANCASSRHPIRAAHRGRGPLGMAGGHANL